MIPRNADVDDSDADTDDELLSEWSDKQISMWADESFFLRYCKSFRTDSNLIQNIATFFQTKLDSVRNFFLALDMFFVSKPNPIRFGNVLKIFLRFVFRTELESVRKRTLFKM